MAVIYPSLMSADQLHLGNEIRNLEPHVVGFHIDVMDYHFAPNLTFGLHTINQISAFTMKQLWLHMMLENPTHPIEHLTLPAQTIYSFHIESNFMKDDILHKLKEKKWLPSIAINPKTNVAQLFEILDHRFYQVLIMSVEPGFSGQDFIPETIDKIKALQTFRMEHNLPFVIGLDGGIKKSVMDIVFKYGIQDIATASAIFGDKDRIRGLNSLIEA